MTAQLRFVTLCWRAYGGDVDAGLEVLRILRSRNSGLKLVLAKLRLGGP